MSSAGGSIHVRAARAGDDSDPAGLDAVAWSPASGFPSVIRRAAGSFFSATSTPDDHLVAEINGAAVGYIRLRRATALPENAHVMEVAGLAVHPGARRRGVASALLTAAGQHAHARGARKLSLRVLSTNQPALRLYLRRGFRREGTLRNEFLINGRYVDDVLLARQLGASRRARSRR